MRYNKYNNKKVIIDGIKFDSNKEAQHYKQLKLLERAGEIKNLKLQPRYELIPQYTLNNKKIRKCEYIADFEYVDKRTGEVITEDVKRSKD